MLHFENTSYLYLAIMLAPAIFLLWWYIKWYRKAANRLARPEVINKILPEYSVKKQLLSGATVVIAALLLIIGLANLQFAQGQEKIRSKSLDMVIAIDVSRSMMADDVKPSRLDKARLFASQVVSKLGNDRVGLVVFAGDAFIESPLTSDHAGINMFLDQLSPDMITTQGTAISQAFDIADRLLYPKDVKVENGAARTVLLITDGEDHESSAEETAKQLASKGTTIYTACVGTKEGAKIPLYQDGVPIGLLKDETGNIVVSKPNEELLKNLAHIGQGAYYNIAQENEALGSLTGKLARLQRSDREEILYTRQTSIYQWFIGAAILLLLMEYILSVLKRTKIA